MFEPNVTKILASLQPTDVVLDIGGWACPFNRANFVMDAEPFDTRGFYKTFGGSPSQGGRDEFFDRDRWIQRDICDRTPYPFADKSIDFVICSHTLEDIRDPIWVCREIVRIGKRGYIEVPSRTAETLRGWEHRRTAGLSHHRWLIDIEGNHIRFLMKYHRIHSHWRFSLPSSFGRRLPESQKVQWLFWDGGFSVEEITIHGSEAQEAELERFVERAHPYPHWLLRMDRDRRRLANLVRRIRHAAARRLKK